MFFPTMLGSSRSTQESDDAEAGGMMSAFYTDAAASRFAQYRPYAAGGAVIAVMAIVLWAFSSTQDASNEVANETTPVPNSVIQHSQASEVLAPQTTAVKTSVVKNADKPLSLVSASPSNAVKPKEEKSEKKSDVKVRPDADPKTAKSSSNNSRPAEVKRSVKKQSSPLVNKPTGSTRPRIVMNGKP